MDHLQKIRRIPTPPYRMEPLIDSVHKTVVLVPQQLRPDQKQFWLLLPMAPA